MWGQGGRQTPVPVPGGCLPAEGDTNDERSHRASADCDRQSPEKGTWRNGEEEVQPAENSGGNQEGAEGGVTRTGADLTALPLPSTGPQGQEMGTFPREATCCAVTRTAEGSRGDT